MKSTFLSALGKALSPYQNESDKNYGLGAKDAYQDTMIMNAPKAVHVTPGKVASPTVEEIHKAFKTNSERWLQKSEEVLSKIPEESADTKLKRELGFTSAKGVKEEAENRNKRAKIESTRKILDYYSQTYPIYKFVQEESITFLCEKYNLVFGKSSDYLGEIPMKNLLEIAAFKNNNPVKKEDRVVIHNSRDRTEWMPLESYMDTRNISEKEINSLTYKMFICAPQKDMNMRGKTVNSKMQIVDEPKDPIVLFPVRAGFLIVSAWGDEASDSAVVNEKKN